LVGVPLSLLFVLTTVSAAGALVSVAFGLTRT
jgi:hypothetical protein